MKVINLFGGPGSGKSTTAAGLFHMMKLQHLECEIVTEYAKDLVWAERVKMFSEQDYIFAKQNHKLRRLIDKVDWAITDSPIILSHFYIGDEFPGKEHFLKFVQAMYESYDNINVYIERVKPYNQNGRNQSETQSRMIDRQMKQFLIQNNIDFITVDGDERAPNIILDHILNNV